MANVRILPEILQQGARAFPDRVAVIEPGKGSLTYRELDSLAQQLGERLVELGVRPGDRVGLCLAKSADAVAAIWGVLRVGAAYVPVDAEAPAWRNAFIFNDCKVRVIVLEQRVGDALREEWAKLGALPTQIELERVGAGEGLRAALGTTQPPEAVAVFENTPPQPDDLAYILYTSGSTGKPKGVMLSHRNALCFIQWCSETFHPHANDRFSSHAPFHFDLSIFDLYVPMLHGASVVLIGNELGKEPHRLAPFISEQGITSWYSTPSSLSLLAHYGKLERFDYSALRMIFFAGEVFPVKHLRTLHTLLPHPRYFNLYGPTETNVCTYYEIPSEIPPERTEPYPIGKACAHYRVKLVDESGQDVAAGEAGELVVAGEGVMLGYWNLQERTAKAFLELDGVRWYKTGDVCAVEADGIYRYVGRRDRMVKRRGYRIELDEIESGLHRHPAIRQAAVIALPDAETGVRIFAFLTANDQPPGIVEMKKFCAQALPGSMSPDVMIFRESIPKTTTDKTDYQMLQTIARAM